MNVLHVIPAYYPATYWGGPIYSVYELCNTLSKKQGAINLRVLASDSAGPSTRERVTYLSTPERYNAGYDVYFSRRYFGSEFSPFLYIRIILMSSWANVIHVTGVYSFSTLVALAVAKILLKPVVWSPRGALQRWDKSTNSLIKHAWEKVCNYLVDSSRCTLHVTSEEEAVASRNRIRNLKIAIIPNGVVVPPYNKKSWRPDDSLRLLFLGRLHEIKGLENLLKAIKRLPNNISLSIYGSGEENYTKKLQKLIDELNIGKRVSLLGHVTGEEKDNAFSTADVCIVPSHIENFGMVIAESLAHGLPVIASQGTPWKEINKKGCGMWVKNSPSSLAKAVVEISERNLSELGAIGRAWMLESYSWYTLSAQMENLYNDILVGEKQGE